MTNIDHIKEALRELGISEGWMPQVLGRLVEVAESSTVDGFNGLLELHGEDLRKRIVELADVALLKKLVLVAGEA